MSVLGPWRSKHSSVPVCTILHRSLLINELCMYVTQVWLFYTLLIAPSGRFPVTWGITGRIIPLGISLICQFWPTLANGLALFHCKDYFIDALWIGEIHTCIHCQVYCSLAYRRFLFCVTYMYMQMQVPHTLFASIVVNTMHVHCVKVTPLYVSFKCRAWRGMPYWRAT